VSRTQLVVALTSLLCAASVHSVAARADDQAPPCAPEQLLLSASRPQAAAGHRAVTLIFALADGAGPCTLTGYPGVDSGAGGPLVHAQRTMHGYMGGLPADISEPPTVTLTPTQPAQSIVEGVAVDPTGGDTKCPNYTDLLVTAPDTTYASTVPARIDTCQLQVHPVTT
jgi:hypothetical protein